MLLASVLDACVTPDPACYALRESFLQILALLSALWGCLVAGLVAMTGHRRRLWFALLTVLPLPAIWWLLSVSTPHGGIHGLGVIFGWGWASGTALLAWKLSKGSCTSATVRIAAIGATCVALAAPFATAVLEDIARDRMLLPSTALGDRANGNIGPAVASPAPVLPRSP